MIKVAFYLTLVIWMTVAIVSIWRSHVFSPSPKTEITPPPAPVSLFETPTRITEFDDGKAGQTIRLVNCRLDSRAFNEIVNRYDHVTLQGCEIDWVETAATDYGLLQLPDGTWRMVDKFP